MSPAAAESPLPAVEAEPSSEPASSPVSEPAEPLAQEIAVLAAVLERLQASQAAAAAAAPTERPAPCDWLAERVEAALAKPAVRIEEAARPEAGDAVLLGSGVPADYRHKTAVVMEVYEQHCTVMVLDEEGRKARGELWPYFHDFSILTSIGRLGNRVRLRGLKGNKKLNGQTGTVCEGIEDGQQLAHPFLFAPKKGQDMLFLVSIRKTFARG